MPKKKATKKKAENKPLPFEDELWEAIETLWGHIDSAQYRKVIIGLIFLRYISAAFEKRYQELVEEGLGFENDMDFYRSKNIFYVPEKARWDVISAAAHTPEIGTVIDNAMREIEKENKELKGVLYKDFASPDMDQRILGDVVDIFTNQIDLKDHSHDQDLLGRAYEFCLTQFAQKEGHGGEEFYTPASIVKTLVAVTKPQSGMRIYDPCMGSGGMFVQASQYLKDHVGVRDQKTGKPVISIYGQESKADTWKMAKMNMVIRGIDANFGPRNEDTFWEDLHKNVKMDLILANPPFNFKKWWNSSLEGDKRWKYGVPPEGNGNYAWIQHMLSHLSPKGKIGLVLAKGALTTSNKQEFPIRKGMVDDDLIEGIINLPDKMFFTTGIPASLWFFSRRKNPNTKGKMLFVDARELGHMVDRTHRDFSQEDIDKIAKAFDDFRNGTLEEEKGFSKIASIDDVKINDYALTPGRYVGIKEEEDDGEPFDEKMKRLTGELGVLLTESHKLEEKIRKNLMSIGYEIPEISN